MRVAIVGCGLIGRKRMTSFKGEHQLVAAADAVLSRAEALAALQKGGAAASTEWRAAVEHPEAEAVVVATTNEWLAPVTLAAIQAGKHVLVEKPAATNAAEIAPLLDAAAAHDRVVQVGFNHRYHPGFQKAREIVDSGALGPLMFIRGRYGHGGRIGYDKEWRADPKASGGGELLDQGVHLIDLSRWFLGDFTRTDGYSHTYFWDMAVEDNGFMLLRTERNQTAFLHASCTEWKNMFSFEIYGRDGKLHIEGLGGSYGVERLYYYKMLPEMGPPETTIWEYPGEDKSWRHEFDLFCRAVQEGRAPDAGLSAAAAALRVVEEVYRKSRL